MLEVTRYNIAPATWPADLKLKIAVIADIHACEPWMPAARIREIAEVANALQPDLTVLLGDFAGGHKFVTGPVMPDQWAEALSVLRAPLGVFSVLGNDWADDGQVHLPAMRMAAEGQNDPVRHLWKDVRLVREQDGGRVVLHLP